MKFYIGDNSKVERIIDRGGEKYVITGTFMSRELTDLKTASNILYRLMKEGFEIKNEI